MQSFWVVSDNLIVCRAHILHFSLQINTFGKIWPPGCLWRTQVLHVFRYVVSLLKSWRLPFLPFMFVSWIKLNFLSAIHPIQIEINSPVSPLCGASSLTSVIVYGLPCKFWIIYVSCYSKFASNREQLYISHQPSVQCVGRPARIQITCIATLRSPNARNLMLQNKLQTAGIKKHDD